MAIPLAATIVALNCLILGFVALRPTPPAVATPFRVLQVQADTGTSPPAPPATPWSSPPRDHSGAAAPLPNPKPPAAYAGPPRIALSFDDGPSAYYTEQVLATLRYYRIHATFFVIGRQAAAFPTLVAKAAADGNEVENHTWNHADLNRLSTDAATAEIAATAGEVLLLTGRAPRYMRPPYGSTGYAVRADAAVMGEDAVLWNVDPRDWALPSVWAIQENVLANATDRSIVIMHDGGGPRDETVAALQIIIPKLRARGFRFVTVQELLDPLAPTFAAATPARGTTRSGSH